MRDNLLVTHRDHGFLANASLLSMTGAACASAPFTAFEGFEHDESFGRASILVEALVVLGRS